MTQSPDIQNNEEILNNIQSLQQIEQQFLTTLETNPNLSRQQQEDILDKITRITNMRLNLYNTLSGINNFFENALQNSVGTLKQQVTAISIVENELNHSKKQLELLEIEKTNNIRLVQINNYYSDKYAEHSQIMKIVIFTLIPVIIITFLHNKSILSDNIYYILLIIVSFIGAFYFWYKFISIIMRDNMIYDEYDWSFDPSSAPKASSSNSSSSDPWATNINVGTCVGELCCSAGQTYDNVLNQCVAYLDADSENTNSGNTDSGNAQNPEPEVDDDTCKIIGNSNYNQKCLNSFEYSSCESGCATSVSGLGKVCCTSSCCNSTENFQVNDKVTNVLTKTQQGKYKPDYNLGELKAYNS